MIDDEIVNFDYTQKYEFSNLKLIFRANLIRLSFAQIKTLMYLYKYWKFASRFISILL